MTTSIYREVVNRLAVDASFRTRLAADTEGALREFGYRLSEDEHVLLWDRMMNEVLQGRASEAYLDCPCGGHKW